MAGRVAPLGKPPRGAAPVGSPFDGLPSVVSSRCSCGGCRVDFRYYYCDNSDNDNNNNSNINRSDIVDCHCAACRRFHVAAFVRYLRVPENDVSVTGDTAVRFRDACASVGEVLRTYCRKCSTKLLTTTSAVVGDSSSNRPEGAAAAHDQNAVVLVNMGPIDDQTIPDNVAQQWKKSKPNMWSLNMEASWATAVPPPHHSTNVAAPVTVSGGCTCGACQYEFVLQKPLELQHCYCSLCRQLSGGPFMTWVPIGGNSAGGRRRFWWLRQGSVTKTNAGTPQRASAPDRGSDGGGGTSSGPSQGAAAPPPLVRYTDIGQRHVCSRCGGVLSIVYDFFDDGSSIWLAAGAFDSIRFPFNVEPYLDRTVHICCNYKPAWYTLPDDGMPRLGEAS